MKRVVVTGIGAVAPCGNGKNEILKAMTSGKTSISTSNVESVNFYGKVNEECLLVLNRKEKRYMDKASQYAIISAREAMLDSKLELEKLNLKKAGTFMGTSMGGFETMLTELTESVQYGLDRITLLGMPKSLHSMLGANLSIEFGFKGGVYTYNSACASSAMAIGEAYRKIQNGELTVALAGGSEACLVEQVFESFHRLGALSTKKNIEQASIPFSKKRDGFVLSEGAAMLILEEYEHAVSRKAEIYCELSGYGTTSDAVSLVAPAYEGIKDCMANALEDADVLINQIEYINAHGTSTEANDRIESKAIYDLFDSEGHSPYVSSTKSVHGHLLGGAGALEAFLCCLAINTGKIFPQVNVMLDDVDTDIGLNLLLDKPIEYQGGSILSNSFAFGGINVSLVFKPI